MSPLCCVHYFYRFHAYHTIPCHAMPYHTNIHSSLVSVPFSSLIRHFASLLLLVVSVSFSFFSLFFSPIILSFFPGPFPLFGTLLTTLLPLNLQGFFLSFQKYQRGRKGIHPHHLTHTPTYHHIHTYLLSCQVDVSSPLFKLTWVGYPKRNVATIRTMEAKAKKHEQKHGQSSPPTSLLSCGQQCIVFSSMPPASSRLVPSPLFFVLFFFFLLTSFKANKNKNKKKKRESASQTHQHLLTLGQGLVWVCVGLWAGGHRTSSSFSLRSVQNLLLLLLLLPLVPVCLCQCCCVMSGRCVCQPVGQNRAKRG